MQNIKDFMSGYIKTMLFAIEYKPKFQFPQTLFIIPHFIHHAQVASLMLISNQNTSQNQVLDYFVVIFQCSLVEPIMSFQLKIIALVVLFILQIALLFYLLIATFETQRVIHNPKLRQALEKKIESINSILHWYFTFYNVFTMIITAISLAAIQFAPEQYYQAIAFIVIGFQCLQGMILIYLLRNHRFAENNSFKRRFAYTQMLNYALQYLILFFTYTNNVNLVQVKFIIGMLYSSMQIVDQFYGCPYRDPFRQPSLKVAMILLTTAVISYMYYAQDQNESLFLSLLLATGVMSGVSDAISGQFHEFAMTSYNHPKNIQEKYIILGVDQLYQHFNHFKESDEVKIQFFQQLNKHRGCCRRSKCASQGNKLSTINTNNQLELNKLAMDIISCIFKTSHTRQLVSKGMLVIPKFEQLQLQYISFLSSFAQRPLLGYVELRAYQINKNKANSLYFRELTSKISLELEFQILYLQDRMIKQKVLISKFGQQEDKLTIAQVWKSVNFYQLITPKLLNLIKQKQEYWTTLMEGYNHLKTLQRNQLSLSATVDAVYIEILTTIPIPEIFFDRQRDVGKAALLKGIDADERTINVLNLKVYSILYSVVLNDFDRAFQAEKQIEELIKEDRQKEEDIIDDQALIKDDALIILVSMVRKRGHIVNSNLITLANFFGFKRASDIQAQTEISSYLPISFKNIHDQCLNGLISKGYTKYSVQSIHSYFVQQQGYLVECFVKLSNLFQDPDDFVLTASLFKVKSSAEVIMFDANGKILGVTEALFKEQFQQFNEHLTLERLISEGTIYTVIPSILPNLTKYAKNPEVDFDFVDYQYSIQGLQELNTELAMQFSGKLQFQGAQSSYNLSTFRSNAMSINSNRTTVSNGDCLQLDGVDIPLLNNDKQVAILDFITNYQQEKQIEQRRYKFKCTISHQIIKTKKDTFPYFVLKLAILSENEASDSQLYLNYSECVKRTQAFIKFGEQAQSTFGTKEIKRENKQQHSSFCDESQIDKMKSVEIADIQSITPIQSVSQAPVSDILEITDNKLSKIVFENPKIAEFGQIESNEFDFLAQELNDASHQQLHQNKSIIQEDAKNDSDLQEKKSNISQKNINFRSKNILELFQTNKRDNAKQAYDPDVQQSSKASSQLSTSSKSPFSLIRSLYQLKQKSVKLLVIILLNYLICAVLLTLLFVVVAVVQDQYQNLQNNLNFVQFPETINNFYAKSVFLSTTIVENKLGFMNYTEATAKTIQKEYNELAMSIESSLNQIYQDIISFENEVIKEQFDITVVNNLTPFVSLLDLTLLLEHMSATSIQINQQIFKEDLNNQIVSNYLFLRLNMITVNKVSRAFIQYLNQNLKFYQDQIVNAVTYIVVSEICIITFLVILQVKIWQNINVYQKKILMLTTKLTEQDALQSNANMQNIRVILMDQQQILWKTINFVPLIFERNTVNKNAEDNQNVQSYSKDKKKDRRYHNSALTARIYNLNLPQHQNFIVLFLIWLFATSYLLGALGFSITMISQIKPAVDINLQLIEFKLRFDSLIAFGEQAKVDPLLETYLRQQFNFSKIAFDYPTLTAEFSALFDGFQDQLTTIYNELSASTSLLQSQKDDLLIPFTTNICDIMTDIPSCNSKQIDLNEDSYEYISGGIVNMVYEFSKTIRTYLYDQLSSGKSNDTLDSMKQYLASQVHKTQFLQHFLYQGKQLDSIATKMLYYNRITLDSVIVQFQLYIYIAGPILIVIFAIIMTQWMSTASRQIYLQSLGLTLIPSDSLNELKTIQELKAIQAG